MQFISILFFFPILTECAFVCVIFIYSIDLFSFVLRVKLGAHKGIHIVECISCDVCVNIFFLLKVYAVAEHEQNTKQEREKKRSRQAKRTVRKVYLVRHTHSPV